MTDQITPERKDQDNNVKVWAMFVHLSALLGFSGIPFASILGPLLIWLIKKNEMPFLDRHGKQSMNFQLSMLLYVVVSLLLSMFYVGLLFLFPLLIINVVFVIIASTKAYHGEEYQYPFSIKFIKE